MFFLLLLVAIIVIVAITFPKAHHTMDESNYHPKEWIKAGGILGMAIMMARLTRMPLATILTALPFVLHQLRKADNEQQKTSASMTREEAALILGVLTDASEEAIKNAHRALITKNHPDKGGSDYLAAKINQARDVLLKK